MIKHRKGTVLVRVLKKHVTWTGHNNVAFLGSDQSIRQACSATVTGDGTLSAEWRVSKIEQNRSVIYDAQSELAYSAV